MANIAVFFDRDGVLNKAVIKKGKPYPPASPDLTDIPDDVPEALMKLKQAGFILIGATNQPDVPRGKTSKHTVEEINKKLLAKLPLETIFVCYHDDQDQCHCRKPLPGLLIQAAKMYDIDLKKSFMIGDRWKDIEAGRRAGCKTIWLDYQYQENFLAEVPDATVSTVNEAADYIINYLS